MGWPAGDGASPARAAATRRPAPFRRLWSFGALILLGLAGLFAGLPFADARAQTLVAVFPPWWSQAEIWRAATGAGDVVGAGGSPFVLVLRSRGGDFDARARRAGAFLLLDARGLGACGDAAERTDR